MRYVKSCLVGACILAAVAAPVMAENYAILFAGGVDRNWNWSRYYTNTLRMYNLVVGWPLNYKAENVWVLASDGLNPALDQNTGSTFVDSNWSTVVSNGSTVLAATHDNLQTTLQNLFLGPADMLYMWTFDHGHGTPNRPDIYDEELLNGWGNDIRDDELYKWTRNPACGRRAFVFGQCYSGGMVDALGVSVVKNAFACAATNHYETSWEDGFVRAFADGMSGHDYTRTHQLYQHAYQNDPYATDGEGPGGTYNTDSNKCIEHPWKIGADLDLAVAAWKGSGAGGAGQDWTDAGNWRQQPNYDRAVRVSFSSNGTVKVSGIANAGYLTVDGSTAVGAGGYLLLDSIATRLYSVCQVVGDGVGGIGTFGYVEHHLGGNTVSEGLYLGYNGGGEGWYRLDGNNLEVKTFHVGRAGKGRFLQYGGAVITKEMFVGELSIGDGNVVLRGGSLTADSEYIGHLGVGRVLQTGGTHTVNKWMAVGWGPGSSGSYRLTDGTLHNRDVQIGDIVNATGTGSFSQSGGVHTVSGDMAVVTKGSYSLSGGVLGCRTLGIIWGGKFTQFSGVSTFTWMFMSGTGSVCDVRGGIMSVGSLYLYDHAKLNHIGGVLNVVDANTAAIRSGEVSHTGGDVSVTGYLEVGCGGGADGTYTLDIDSNVGGSLTVGIDFKVGTESGKGRFDWRAGAVTTPRFTMGARGTLAMGRDFNVRDLVSGALFTGGATMTGLNYGMVEVTGGATATRDGNTGPHELRAVRVGSGSGSGTYRKSGGTGTDTIGYLEVNSNGRFEYTGGRLSIANGGLHLAGKLDFGDSNRTLQVGDNALVNLVDAQFLNCERAVFNVNGPNSLTILPSGFDPYQFASYVNNGRTHTAGSMLVMGTTEDYTFQGHIGDHVRCEGAMTATSGGYIHLGNGVEIDGGGAVDLGDGMLTVNDFASNMAPGGRLAAGEMQIGAGGTGSFTHYGGTQTVSGPLTIGRDANDAGTYEVYGGNLFADTLIVGLQGRGTLRIHNSDPNITVSRKLHFGPDSVFEAAAGARIHMTGAALENENTDPLDLAGLGSLTLIFEGGAEANDPFEVAGARDGGFAGNFALGSMILGGMDVGKVRLVDQSDNGRRTPGFGECLFVSQLTINSGSSLDLNGLDLYVAGDAVGLLQGYVDDGSIHDSMGRGLYAGYDAAHDWTLLPEPATLALLALGGLAVVRRRRK